MCTVKKINILLIEENRLLQEGITAMLHSNGEFEVVARFEDADAVRQLRSLNLHPDIVLLDLGLQRINSLTLMALLKEEIPAARIVAMDILPNHVDIMEFVRAGGDALILKNAPAADWFSTLNAVAKGESVLPPVLTQPLFNQIISDALTQNSAASPDADQLTMREREIVNLIAEGLSNREIAERLHIATYTVKSHVHNILEKLALNTRLQIAAYLRKEND
jgi:two-component system, NarL family, nitrate/nitrite response regulator NarL